jgi:hypothetical protein
LLVFSEKEHIQEDYKEEIKGEMIARRGGWECNIFTIFRSSN